MANPKSTRHSTPQIDEPPAETLIRAHRSRCYFLFPCFGRPADGPAWWHWIRANEAGGGGSPSSLWAKGVGALMKIREWSEIVAGPRWKTFIRRFNRNRTATRHANFQYDPLSYAMNFDEGPAGDRHLDEEGEDGYYNGSRNFSARYAKGSMDHGRDGASFV